jgi:uncharacterized membrane protein YcaP (DUF421 family)
MDTIREALGVGVKPEHLTVVQVSLRALVVFVGALLMLRLSARRVLGRKTAFDIILMFILGSMLARAVNGSSPVLGTLVAGFVLVLFHRLLALLAYHVHWFGTLVKGQDNLIIRDGELQSDALRKSHLSRSDVMEDLRLRSVTSPSEVKEARLERSGDVSVLRRQS